jgi:membrane-bound serine protease (ClpP class)
MLSLGMLGILVELYNPGLIFPATLGGICLIVGLYGLQVLPVNWAGLLLMLLAAGFWGAEPFVMSHGALALAGAAAFVFGALLLFDPAGDAYQVSLPVVIAIAAAVAVFLAFVVAKVVQVRRRPVAVGSSTIVGLDGSADGGVARHMESSGRRGGRRQLTRHGRPCRRRGRGQSAPRRPPRRRRARGNVGS